MAKIIEFGTDETALDEAVAAFRAAKKAVVLTGAGVSVESGIPDFRSPGGLWTVYAPEEYATLEVFLYDPVKAWVLYRAINETLAGSEPNPGHEALARLEEAGKLAGIVTQNVDGLHQAAGSENVIEIHGDHQHLQCLQCETTIVLEEYHFSDPSEVPTCEKCASPLKPNVVLFSEGVRHMDKIMKLMSGADAIIVAGTSAQVSPANTMPALVNENGGLIFEFNIEETALTAGMIPFFRLTSPVASDYLFKGRSGTTLPAFADRVLAS